MGRVEVELDEDTHQDWRDHINEDNRYKTMTQLIRFAVGEQIDRDNQDTQIDSDIDIDTDEIVDKIIDPIEELSDDIKSMENDIIQTQRVIESQNDEKYIEMAMEIHDFVPTLNISKPENIDLEDVTEDVRVRNLITTYKRNIDELVKDEDIEIALARLENDVRQVKSEIINNNRIYYKI